MVYLIFSIASASLKNAPCINKWVPKLHIESRHPCVVFDLATDGSDDVRLVSGVKVKEKKLLTGPWDLKGAAMVQVVWNCLDL